MATMLATEDVAALVSAFPPPTPSKDRPSLVRSTSGDNLITSEEVLSRFRNLLRTSQKRIKISELRNVLGIQSADWVVDCYDGIVHFSRDRRAVIPGLEMSEINEELHSKAGKEFVSLQGYSVQKDVSSDSWDRLREGQDSIQSESGEVFVGSKSLANEIRTRLDEVIAGSAGERVNLTTVVPDIPRSVLVESARASSSTIAGTFETINGEVIFTPRGYELLQAEQRQAARETRIEGLLQLLETDGFIEVDVTDNPIADEAGIRYAAKHSDEVERQIEGTVSRIVSMSQLDQFLHEMKESLPQYEDTRAAGHNSTLDHGLMSWLTEQSSNKALAGFVLRSKYKRQIDNAWSDLVQEQSRAQFQMVMSDTIMIPLHLYAQGLGSISEPSLRQRLDSYILEYCKLDTLPQLDKVLREKGLLQVDKSRVKELEKFKAASESARSLSDLEAAVSKLANKVRITPPNAEELGKVKRDILHQKLQAMSKMSRASDVLQNTIWILLAEKRDGLFMSPGKDTSRMIKQFQLVGDDQTVKQLEEWRDMLKKGEESHEMVKNMQDLASKTVLGLPEAHH